jgi:hypothetical protein
MVRSFAWSNARSIFFSHSRTLVRIIIGKKIKPRYLTLNLTLILINDIRCSRIVYRND